MYEHYNCNVTIVNTTAHTMELAYTTNPHGDYSPAPPQSIPPGATVSFALNHHEYAPYGPEGSCTYMCTGANNSRAVIQFSYACPTTTGENKADAGINGIGLRVQMIPNPLPGYGHPVTVQFTVIG